MKIEGQEYKSCHISTQNSNILIIAAKNGFIACGYFNLEISNKNNDACAIITGVKTLDDLLTTEVKMVSNAARISGVREGMKGKEALLLLS